MQEDPNQITFFAQTNSRGTSVPFGIKRQDRARHMYVIGKTGMGKSTLLENMAIQDIRNGEGVAFIDPHGSTADRIMEYVPEHRIKDVVYFAPFDMDHPVAFNVMEDVGYDKRHLVVSGLMSAFQKIWEDAWSARMEYILSNTLLALLEYEGATLLDVNRMLVGTFKKTGNGIDSVKDTNTFRYKVVKNITDPQVKNFWVDEFYGYTERYIQEATPAIQNKVGQFTSNPLIRNIVGQPKSSFDIRRLMDEKKILIMNLSKGRVGEVNTNLLGSMLVTKIYLAAMSRADVPLEVMKKLPPFYLYVDEFQNFANKSFSDILSEARKYKLNLLIAHQYVEQMEEEVRDAVFGNVGTTVAFRVGPFDAEALEKIFEPQFTATDLVNLGFAQIYLTLMIDGVGSPPFSATTLPPFDLPPQSFVAEVKAASRATFGKPRFEVEAAIEEWQHSDPIVPEAPKPKRPPVSAGEYASARKPAPKSIYESGPAPYNPDPPARAAHAPSSPHLRHEHPSPELKKELETLHKAAAAPAPRFEEPRADAPQPPRPRAPTAAPRPRSQEKPMPPKPHPKVEAPPLGGAKSLREALQMATGRPAGHASVAPARPKDEVGPPGGVHAPDLKDALQRLAPQAAAAGKEKAPQENRSAYGQAARQENQEPVQKEPSLQPPHKNELSPEQLRAMLAVEPLDDAS